MSHGLAVSSDANTNWSIQVKFYLDIECLDIGKAPEETRQHPGFNAGSKFDLNCQHLDTRDNGVWACLSLSLQLMQFVVAWNGKKKQRSNIARQLFYKKRLFHITTRIQNENHIHKETKMMMIPTLIMVFPISNLCIPGTKNPRKRSFGAWPIFILEDMLVISPP